MYLISFNFSVSFSFPFDDDDDYGGGSGDGGDASKQANASTENAYSAFRAICVRKLHDRADWNININMYTNISHTQQYVFPKCT